MAYYSHAQHVEVGQTVAFFDMRLPDDLFGVAVNVTRIRSDGTKCCVTIDDGRTFFVPAISQVQVAD